MDSFILFFVPNFAITFSEFTFLGELLITFWLLIKGVNIEKWKFIYADEELEEQYFFLYEKLTDFHYSNLDSAEYYSNKLLALSSENNSVCNTDRNHNSNKFIASLYFCYKAAAPRF